MKAIKTVLALLIISAVIGVQSASACTTPVFEYALQFWMPADYEVFVFHEGPLFGQHQQIVTELEELSDYRRVDRLNVRVTRADIAGEMPEHVQKLWEGQSSQETPRLVVCLPPMARELFPIWSGELTAENIEMLAGSPLRTRIAKELLGGTSILWVLLESGNQQQDEAAAKVIHEALPKLEEELVLPMPYDYGYYEEEGEDGEEAAEPEAEHPELNLIRVAADSPDEKLVLSVLSASLPEERWKPSQAPLAFPVFGRGRVLDVLVGEEISERNIEDISWFLTGACQCTVKAQNPGLDLLMAANWDDWQMDTTAEATAGELENVELTGVFSEAEEPEEPAATEPAETDPTDVADPASETSQAAETTEQAEATEEGGDWLARSILLAALAVAACAVAGTLLLRRKYSANR